MFMPPARPGNEPPRTLLGVRGTGGRAVDIHDAAEWVFGEIAKASVGGDDTDPGGESNE